MFVGRWKKMVITIISIAMILSNFINALPVLATSSHFTERSVVVNQLPTEEPLQIVSDKMFLQSTDTEAINGLKNLEFPFTTLEEKPLSSTVGEKPRMLIFFNIDCRLSQNTLTAITQEKLPGIDVVAVDMGVNSKEQVQDFVTSYSQYPGTEDITFCYLYHEIQIYYNYKNAYQEVYPDMNFSNLPIIYYIGTDNVIKHATANVQTLQNVKDNLLYYFGYGVERLNVTNPSNKTLKTVADETVSTVAEGKPKVLILGNSDNYVKGVLSEIEGNFPEGVDIYYLPVWMSNKDEAISFKNSITEEGKIIYCYDAQTDFINLPELYLGAANRPTNSYSFPIMCYLDSNNMLQYVNVGESTGEQVINILKATCGYVPIEEEPEEEPVVPPVEEFFTVTFNYGDKLNSKTQEVKKGEKAVMPEEVELEGFTFGGWYADEALTTLWNFEENVINGPTTIYAKWEVITQPPVEEEFFTVTFNYGDKLNSITQEVKKGEKVAIPGEVEVEGFTLVGWYAEEELITPWNFEENIINGPITIYAKWEEKSVDPGESEDPVLPDSKAIKVAPIEDLVYTGKALKPVVQVYDGEKLLQLNKDYKVTYKNNINANAGGVRVGEEFNEALPHVIITGKGNYSGTLQVNFNIRPIEIRDEKDVIDSRLKVNITDQLVVNTQKAVAPFKSVKLGKTLKSGRDYTVSLEVLNATASNGEKIREALSDGKIPAGAKGNFILTLTFTGNYSGIVNQVITVAEKTELMKNATVTLKKEYRTIDFETFVNEYQGKLPKGAYEVKMGNTVLEEEKDYVVEYQNEDRTGTATLIINGAGNAGMGNYRGLKTVTFKLAGKALTASRLTLENFGNLTFMGEELTQKDLIVKYEGKALTEGVDYTVSYTKNDKVGTATMTIAAKEGSYYQGSVKKTFKITAADITRVKQPEAITVPYSKAGARPVAEVVLENALGQTLVNGKDYTLSYKNNKKVAQADGGNGPVIVVKGKGNYTGTLEIPFTITGADLSKCSITVKPVAYNAKKADSYAYKPTVTIKDGNKTLSSKTDFSVEYVNNTQAAYKAYYIDKVEGAPRPAIIISDKEGSNYAAVHMISMEIPVYRIKLTAKNIYAVISEAGYTGKQATPEVQVYYSPDSKVIKEVKAKGLTNQEEIEALGLEKLEQADYQVSYGTNLFGGIKKGSLKIEGKGALYGGSVSLKFDIGLRDLNN